MQLGMQGAPADQGNGVGATEGLESRRTPIKLPPMSTTPEREQAIATVEQRPDAALRVTRHWLRQ
jgi:flagellar M-ring protein FliF